MSAVSKREHGSGAVGSAIFPRRLQVCCGWGKLGPKQVRQQSAGRIMAKLLKRLRFRLLMCRKPLQRWYQDRKLDVTPVNPKAGNIEGIDAVASLSDLTSPTKASVFAVSVITPPAVTTTIVQEAHAAGITRIWMQPGSESAEALKFGEEHDMTIVHDYCILVSGDHARSQGSKI